jgi:hypothetical protein
MKIIITESQYKKILLENSSNEVESKFKDMTEFFKKVKNDLKKELSLDFEFSLTWGLTIAGLAMPIMSYLQGKYEGLTSSDISLLTAGIVFTFYFANQKNLKLIIAELKKRGLKDVYDDMIQKTKEFKKVFIKFIESFAVPTTSVINVLAFTLLIPVLPELFNFIMGNPTNLSIKELIIRVAAYVPIKYFVVTLKNLIALMLKRFNGE